MFPKKDSNSVFWHATSIFRHLAHSDARQLRYYISEASFQKEIVSRHAEISLDVDADRDGIVEKNNPNKVSCDGSLLAAASN